MSNGTHGHADPGWYKRQPGKTWIGFKNRCALNARSMRQRPTAHIFIVPAMSSMLSGVGSQKPEQYESHHPAAAGRQTPHSKTPNLRTASPS